MTTVQYPTIPVQSHRWVNITGWRSQDGKRLILNAYGFETKAEAVREQRRNAKDADSEPRLELNRVRPVLVEHIDYGFSTDGDGNRL